MHRHIRHDSIIPDAWAIRMIKFLTITFGVLLASSVSCRAGDSHHTGSRTDPQELLIQLVPDIPDLKVVRAGDLEPNPQGKYHRHAFIRGDFNRDGIEDIAIAGADAWVEQGISRQRNGYVLIASKRKDGSWIRVFFHKFPGSAFPFLIWDEKRVALLVGANFTDFDPGDIVWDRVRNEFKLVPAK
jgi:hypothetical protein